MSPTFGKCRGQRSGRLGVQDLQLGEDLAHILLARTGIGVAAIEGGAGDPHVTLARPDRVGNMRRHAALAIDRAGRKRRLVDHLILPAPGNLSAQGLEGDAEGGVGSAGLASGAGQSLQQGRGLERRCHHHDIGFGQNCSGIIQCLPATGVAALQAHHATVSLKVDAWLAQQGMDEGGRLDPGCTGVANGGSAFG